MRSPQGVEGILRSIADTKQDAITSRIKEQPESHNVTPAVLTLAQAPCGGKEKDESD